MNYHKLVRRLYRCTAQIVALLLVTSGYGLPPAYAWAGDLPNAVDEQVFSLDELDVVDDYTKEELLIHGPEQAPQIDVVQRPTAPPETVLQAQDILSVTAGSAITVISSRGVHNDPTLSADGRRVTFWSTANLTPKRPSPNTMFINEIVAFETVLIVEIYNGGTQAVVMTNWRLRDYDSSGGLHGDYQFPSGFVLDAGAYIEIDYFTCSDNPPSWLCTNIDAIFGPSQAGAVALLDASGNGMDFVRWGTSDVSPPLGTNWTGTNPPTPDSWNWWQDLGRNAASTDTDDGSDWCIQGYPIQGYPTIGYQNYGGCGNEPDNPDGNIEIYVADIKTPELRVKEDVTFTQVSRSIGSILGGFNLQPSISGDGTRIAFFSDRDLIGTNGDENFEIFVYDVASKQIYSVTNSLKGANILPSINEDGTRIAFVSDRDGNQEIFIAEVDGSWNVNIIQVTDTSGNVINDQPSISADGNRIAFVSNWNHQGNTSDDNLEIYVVTIGAGKPYAFERITATGSGTANEQPSIDGDGSHVAYTRFTDSTSDVYWAKESSGWSDNLIPATGAINEYPAINSYGDRIVFVSGQSVILYYTEFGQVTVLATVLDTNIQPSRPDIATTSSYLDTWVAFAAGGALYHVYAPLQDITVNKKYVPSDVGPGDTVTYTIEFANHGLDPAPSAILTDTLPSELQGVTCWPSGYTLVVSGPNECRWNLSALTYGTQGVVTVTAVIPTGLAEGHRITNTAGITSGTPEANTANNFDTEVITIINLPPTAADDLYTIPEDFDLAESPDGVLTNDTDLNGDTLTATLVTDVSSGTLTLNQNGGFVYDPYPNFNGTDSFVYRAYDGHGGTATATVTISVTAVNDAPVNWLPGPQTVTEDHDLTLSLSSGNAITVSDVDAGSNAIQVTLTVTDGTLTLGGTAGLSFSNGDGIDDATMTFVGTIAAINTALDGLVFSPTLNFSGTTGLQIVSNDQGYTGPGARVVTDTLSITVIGVNDAPLLDLDGTTAGKDAQHTYEGAELFKWIAPNAVVTDVDSQIAYATVTLLTRPDGLSETLACGACGFFITPSYDGATYTLLMTGTQTDSSYQSALQSVTYDNSSKPPQLGDREIRVVIYDTGGLTDTAISTVTLINSRPVATDDLALTLEEITVTIYVLANDYDLDGDPLTITLITAPAHGTATAVTVSLPLTMAIVYTPDHNFDGTDVFTYVITDGHQTATAQVTVVVTGVNDAPTNTVPIAPSTPEDVPLTFTGAGNQFAITDVDAYTNAVQVALTVTRGILTLSGVNGLSFSDGDGTDDVTMVFSGTIGDINTALDGMVFSPRLNYSGPASITIHTDDLGHTGIGDPLSDTDTVAITITAVNDPPELDLNGPYLGTEYGAFYAVGDPPVSVVSSTAMTVFDLDSAYLVSATVTIQPPLDGSYEVLTAAGTATITVSYDGPTGVLTLSGTDTVANYQGVLRTVSYSNTSSTPTTAVRVLEFIAHDDGGAQSAVVTSRVSQHWWTYIEAEDGSGIVPAWITTDDQCGMFDNAYDYPGGNNDWMSLPVTATTGKTQFSVAFWVKTEQTSSPSTDVSKHPTIMGIRTLGEGSNDVCIALEEGQLSYWHGLKNNTENVEFRTGTPINNNSWRHVVLTNNGSAIRLYLDGSLTSGTINGSGSYNWTPSDGSGLANVQWNIGDSNDHSFSPNFDGLVDEFGFWDRALTPSEIATIYNGGTGRTIADAIGVSPNLSNSLSVYYPFDNDANDASPAINGSTAYNVETINGNVARTSCPSAREYLYWNGAENADSNPPSGNHVTYSFDVPAASHYEVHFRVAKIAGNNEAYWVKIDSASVADSINISRSTGWVHFNDIFNVADWTWTWDQVHNDESSESLVRFYLLPGTHTLRLGYRDKQTYLDQIYITNSGGPAP